MRSSLTPDYLRVELSIEECLRVADGGIVGDRPNLIFADAKIAIRRLEDYSAEDLEKAQRIGQAFGQLFSNEDLDIYIPSEALRMTYIPRVVIPRDGIIGSNTVPGYLEHYVSLLPPEGIEVCFDGSFRRVDLSQQFA